MTNLIRLKQIETGSLIQPNWDIIINRPVGIVSQSTDLNSLNNFTASYFTDSSSFDTRVTTEKNRINAILSASNADTDTFAEVVNLINSVDLTNDNAFASFYTASNSRISSIEIATGSLVNRLNTIESVSGSWITENETGSFLTSLNGAISSSSQLTSSYDIRYTLSGSISATPSGTISGSSQLTSSFDTRYSLSGSSSQTINTSSFATTGSNSFNGNQNITGSLVVSAVAVVAGALTIPSASVISLTSGSSISVDASGAITGSLTGSVFGIGDVTAFSSSVNSRIISGSSVAGTISSSAQITAFGFISSSTTIPTGTISGSSQLTSSFDTRYILSGSLTAGSNVSVSDTAPTSPTEGDLWWKSDDGNLYVYYDSYWVVATDTISAIPNGVISGSAQITTLGFVSGSYETTGRGIISGSTQLTTSFPSKTIGTWTLPTGASTQSFTVDAGGSYTMWVSGNIPNGIISWNATVTTSNTNVPVIGSQFGWYYVDGNALVLTSIPDQIIGTNGGIISSPSSYPPNTSNVFKFGITNNSGTTQTINYGYIKLS
jgi:hypothetical protein